MNDTLSKQHGFTLIEVLIALMIIAIGLTSLLKTNAQNIYYASRLKDKTFAHQVGMSALADIQSNTINLPVGQESTRTTRFASITWYWRVLITPSPMRTMQQISISVSSTRTGPFTNRLIGYRYAP